MKIGLFTDTYLPDINGVATSIKTLEDELVKLGHEVYIITTKPEFSKSELNDRVLRLPGLELKFLYGYVLGTPFQISAYNIIKSLELDIIHAHTEFSIGIFARICSRLLSIPLISTYHTTYEDYTHYVNLINSDIIDNMAKTVVAKLSKLYGDSSIEVISPSEKTKEMLLRYDIRSDIHVIPTGLDLKRFNVNNRDINKVKEIRDKYGILDDELFVISLGRIAEEKSIDIIIDAFKYVKEDNIKAKLLIVGSGPEEDSLKKQVKALNLEDYVIFAGKKPSEIVPSYYLASDVFVSASLTETQGLTFIEALASGLPVFARPDDVLNELVFDGKTGFYFNTPKELSEKLKSYIELNEEEKNIIKYNAVNVVKPFNSEEFGKKVVNIYRIAIAKYKEMFVIDEIRAKEDHVNIIVKSPNGDEHKLIVTNETYINEGLRKDQKINQNILEKLKKEEIFVKAYQSCIGRIARRDRTRKEIYDWINNNFDIEIKDVNDIIKKLEDRGYIDDYRYAKSNIESMKLSLQGERRIIQNLKRKGIPYEVIQELLEDSDQNEELEHAIKWANKVKVSIKDTSVAMKKNKLYKKMMVQGYNHDIISLAMDHISFVDDENVEIDNLRKAAIKARKKYEKRFKGSKLRNNMFRYLFSIGYRTEDIYVVLDEMEWDDE
ncbi:MAG: RecX family transcriptional regulator [Bacillota bacterium]|nr:RecX family transcriptional regulator [Bacillota bacterium]